jgi:signal transduction histidine kinase
VKYTKIGFIIIDVSRSDDDYNFIEIKFTDTGVGIEKDKIENLFDIYNKNMDDRELNTQGCGLGLSIAKNLSNALGGDIKV